MKSDPGRVCPRRRLVEHRERIGVRVEEIGHDKGGVTSSENGEIDHGGRTAS